MALKIAPMARTRGITAATNALKARSRIIRPTARDINRIRLKSSSLTLANAASREVLPAIFISKSVNSWSAARTGARMALIFSSARSASPAMATLARSTWPSPDTRSGLLLS